MYIENFVVSIPFVMNDHRLLIVATFSDRRPDSETIFLEFVMSMKEKNLDIILSNTITMRFNCETRIELI